MRKILISIKPEYVDLIFSGEKRFEYRKRVPLDVNTAIVYATNPVKKIVGEFRIASIISLHPHKLWEMTKHQSGLSKMAFFEYFANTEIAHALVIKDIVKYHEPVELKGINVKCAPQSWQYID